MAAHPTAFSPLNGVHDERDEQAGRQILRLMSVFVAVGYLAYAVMTAPMLVDSLDVMDTWWTVSAVVLIFGTGVALGPVSWGASVRRIQIAAATAAAGFVVALALWRFGWNGQQIDAVSGIWFSQFPGLAAIAAALAFRAVFAFAYLGIVSAITILISHEIRTPEFNGPLVADIAWSIAFSLIFVSAAVMAIRTAAILDTTRAEAYTATAAAAAANARSAERSRFDALTHDNVMSTLLLASRQGASKELAQNARTALAAVDQAAAGDVRHSVSAFDAIGQIRAAVGLIDPAQHVTVVDGEPEVLYPSGAVSAISTATAEALRNSLRHAGPDAVVEVTITATATSLRADIADNGIGFDPSQVSATRLGIAVSIRGRMAKVCGGTAVIDSSPGSGTLVSVEWSA